MTIFDSKTGKTRYTDADSLSGDLREKVRDGDKDALQKLKEFATNKDPEQPHSQARALYELAEVYFNGFCEVQRSPNDALNFLTQAVDLGDDLAEIRLGEFYRDGKQGFKQDSQKALELFLKAAESGNKNGLQLSAEMFQSGSGGFKADGYRAIEFYEKLDALDDKQALMSIAEIYEEGCGKFKADGQRALEIYDEIIRHGEYWAKIERNFGITSTRLDNYKMAVHNSALIYLEGKAGVVPDGYKAIELFAKLTEEEIDFLKEIADIYLEGKAGVEPDGYKAIEYLNEILQRNEKNSFANPSNAMKILADIWRKGKAGVTQDGHIAVEYLSKLADNDETSGLIMCEPDDALYELGNIYEEGCGEILPDLQRAIDFYKKSAALDNYSAKMKLKKLVGSDNDE